MHPSYMRAVLALSTEGRKVLERDFQLPRKGGLFFRLVNAHADQASVVLSLLRAGKWDDITRFVGHPVPVVGPGALSRTSDPVKTERTPDEERVVDWVSNSNPRILSDGFHRFALIRVGMTVEQLLTRGVRRRDIREWQQEGTLRLRRKK